MSSGLGVAVAIALAILSSPAAAEDDRATLAPDHARRSTTLFVSTELSPLPTVSGQVEVAAALRFHRRGLAVRGTAGVAYAFSPIAGGNLFGARIGGGAGAVLALGCRFTFAPMAGYDLLVYRQAGSSTSLAIHRLTVELPITFVLHRRVVLEGFAQAGIAYIQGTSDLVVIAGPRIGAVF